jgi:hypothetical protein
MSLLKFQINSLSASKIKASEYMKTKCGDCFIVNKNFSWLIDCEHLKCHEHLFEILVLLNNKGEKLPKILVHPYEYTKEKWDKCFIFFEKISNLDKTIFELDFEYMMSMTENALLEEDTSFILTFYKSVEILINSDKNISYKSFFVISENGCYKSDLTINDRSKMVKIFRFSDYDLIIFKRVLANYAERYNVLELKSLYPVSDFILMDAEEEFFISPHTEDEFIYYEVSDIEKHITYKTELDNKNSINCNIGVLAVIKKY